MMKKYLLLTTALIGLSANVYASEVVPCAKGEANCWSCAKDTSSTCTARLSDDGVMTISGEGAMKDSAPWKSQMDQIKHVVMEDTITNVGNMAFHKATNLAKVHISEAVTTIGTAAFEGTTSLTSVNIPASVEEIGRVAFYYSAADTVTFENGSQLKTLGDSTFSGTNISQINLPDGLVTIGSGSLSGTKLTSLDIPDSVESIGVAAFQNATLQKIKFPANLKTLGERAFQGIALTEALEFPNGIEKLGGLTFYGMSVPSIILPESIKEIAKNSYISYANQVYAATEEQENLVRSITGKAVYTYTKNADGTLTLSQKGRELYKYADKGNMLAGTDWLERYQYSDDKKYGGLRQEAYAKDGDGEKYIGAKIFRPDGSIVLVDENNKFINKLHAKIYTVEEAMAATKEGNVNRVRLTYK